MIKVVIIINELLFGGAQRMVVDLVNNIDSQKFEVTLILMKSKKVFSSEFKWLDYQINNKNIKIITISDQKKFKLKDLKILITTLKKIKPDIVHTFLPYAGIIGRVAAYLSGIKKIVSTQCNVPVAYSFKTYWLDKITLRLARVWVAATEGIEYGYTASVEIYNTKSYLAGRRHFTINFAIDLDKIKAVLAKVDRNQKRLELGIPLEVKLVTMTARLYAWKGPEDLIKALAQLDDDIHLALIGDGVMRKALEEQVKFLGIEKRIHFLGTRSDVFEILASSDIYVQAHRIVKDKVWIGRNSAQTEAAAFGLPSISTNVPMIEEFIQDGVTGKIVTANNPDSLAQAIKEMVANYEEAKQMGQRLKAVALEGYSIEKMVSLHEQLYQDVCLKK